MNKTFMLQSAVQHLELHLTAINSFQLVHPSFIIPLLANKTNKKNETTNNIELNRRVFSTTLSIIKKYL